MSKINQPIVPQEVLEFYQELVKIHDKFAGEVLPRELSDENKTTSNEQKVPLLNYVNIEFDKVKAGKVLSEVCQLVAKYRPQVQEELEVIEQKLQETEFPKLLEKFLWQDENYVSGLLKELGVEEGLTSFLLFNVVKPFAIEYARSLSEQYDSERWQEKDCPVCGWKPVYAVHREKDKEKKRLLHCSLCDAEWYFTNLKCPHCLNTDHAKLNYFTIPEDEVYRVNTCEECKGYIKTVDEAKLLAIENSMLTDIKTLHLDMLAEREGYSKSVDATNKDKNLQ